MGRPLDQNKAIKGPFGSCFVQCFCVFACNSFQYTCEYMSGAYLNDLENDFEIFTLIDLHLIFTCHNLVFFFPLMHVLCSWKFA